MIQLVAFPDHAGGDRARADEDAIVAPDRARPVDEALKIIDPADLLGRRQVVDARDQLQTLALRAEQRLENQRRPVPASRSTISAAAARVETTKVAGVGRPARLTSRLVIALSTQRSMAPGSFQTVTPAATSAWSTPSRSVVASKVPPDDSAQQHAVGQRAGKAGHAQGFAGARDNLDIGEREQHRLDAAALQSLAQTAAMPVAVVGGEADAQRVSAATVGHDRRLRPDRIAVSRERRSTRSGRSSPPRCVLPLAKAVTITSAGLNRCGSIA